MKEENESMHEELSKLLQSITSPVHVPEEFSLGDSLSVPPLDFGPIAVDPEDSPGLDMQQIASLFQVEPASADISRQAASCPWSNMPRIC